MHVPQLIITDKNNLTGQHLKEAYYEFRHIVLKI